MMTCLFIYLSGFPIHLEMDTDVLQTILDNEKLGTVHVASWVPQGPILNPILFLIYINDLPDKTRSKIRLLAVPKIGWYR